MQINKEPGMTIETWLGTEKAFNKFASFELKYTFDKDAYASYPYDDPQDICPVFGVDTNRKGSVSAGKSG